MSNRTLHQELATLDDEIEQLETRRTAVIHQIESSGLRKISASNLIRFTRSPRITVSRAATDHWLSDPVPLRTAREEQS